MSAKSSGQKYVPGMYAKKTAGAAELAESFVLDWEKKRLEELKSQKGTATIPFTVCFSRKIGVGALEVADFLAEKTGYRVVDREILEYMARESKCSEKIIGLFDERYPGKLAEFLYLAFGERSFIQSDYTRHLFSAVIASAGLGPSIFVGRGCHMVLPRDRVLAVRFIASMARRVERLSEILELTEEEAERILDQTDREQRDFFRKVYGKKEARAEEFDIVINLDYVTDVDGAANIVKEAFRTRFSAEMGSIR